MTENQAKRLPIRKRVVRAVLFTAVVAMLSMLAVNLIALFSAKNNSEQMLTNQLKQNLKGLVEQKAATTDTRLEHYEMYITFLSDYIENMYRNRDQLVSSGKIIDAPRKSTPKNAYAMQVLYADKSFLQNAETRDDLYFFSHLEGVWDPIVRENEDLISTVYAGTRTGIIPSYDRWSYLSAVPDGEQAYYDYRNSDWFKKGMSNNGVVYSSLYEDSQGRGLTITIGEGYSDAKGVRQGVICADFNLMGLYDEMIAIDAGKEASSFALTSEGEVISPQKRNMAISKDGSFGSTSRAGDDSIGLTKDEIQNLLSGSNGVFEKAGVVYAYAKVKHVGWTLLVRVPKSVVLNDVSYIDKMIWISVLFTVVALLVIIVVVSLMAESLAATITKPMELLGDDMKVIGEGNLGHKATIVRNDEVGDMARHLNDMVDRLSSAISSLADSEKRNEVMQELATRDALTGIRNKLAYDREVQDMSWAMEDRPEPFGIAVIDMNFLKRINDVFGHEQGNIALRKLSRVITEVFSNSPVYRVGGDEFAVILKGSDLESVDSLIEKFNARLESLGADEHLDAWERVSAALGFAAFNPETDASVENVFRRADRAMYARKREMKGLRKD
jgi:diguanylate cyclase (GGDEF)-like protein